jgi:uncharacterized protein YndB with AHSA1/START domain
MNSDKIEKQIELKAAPSTVWRALTNHSEFGQWFGVKMETPFVIGEKAKGRITHPGYEHLVWEVKVKEMDSEKLFSFTWHPYGIDPNVDYSKEEPTLVEFQLERIATGTRLTLIESGFEKVPSHRRAEAFRMNENGWTTQMKNIERHLSH